MEPSEYGYMTYNDTLHSTFLLQNFGKWLTSRTLCDVILVVGEKEIAAHKLVLAASSPYFQAMFCTDLRESSQGRIQMYDIEFNILEEIIRFFYTARIKIRDENVYSVMELADLLQVTSLRKGCSHYLSTSLTASNCLSACVRAGMRDYKELEYAAFRFTLTNFQEVLQVEEFLHVPFETLKRILESRLLNVKDEGEVLLGVVKWLKHDPSPRFPHLDTLISKIDLNNVPMEVLIAVKNDEVLVDTTMASHMTRAVSAILEDRYDNNTAWHNLYKRPVKKQRHNREQEVVLAFGGESIGMALGSVECFTLGYDKWKCVIPTVVGSEGGESNSRVIPTMKYPRFYAAVACTDYDIYVIGGQNATTAMNVCETYNVQSNVWSECCPLPVAIQGAGAALLSNRLHVVGGENIDGLPDDRSWSYDKTTNRWRSLPPMTTARSYLGLACVGGALYALGGQGGTVADALHLSLVERYDPALATWTKVASMREPRSKMGCVAIDEYIYVLGGWDGTFYLKTAERYNTLTNEWTYITPMSIPRSDFSSTVCDRRIYCLGGSDSIHYLNTVEKYNPRTDRWHCVTAMRNRRFALGSATLHVPLTNPSPI